MTNCRKFLPLLLLVLVGCGSGAATNNGWVSNEQTKRVVVSQSTRTYKGVGATKEEMEKVVKPPPPLPPLKDLQFALPAGWDKSFSTNKNEWTLQRRQIFLYGIAVTRAPIETEPKTLDAYLANIRKNPDAAGFIWPQVDQSGNTGDGFYIVGRPRLATDVTNTSLVQVGFIVVRQINGDRFRFICYLISDELRQEALDICKGARF
jgi:hypothetical protein